MFRINQSRSPSVLSAQISPHSSFSQQLPQHSNIFTLTGKDPTDSQQTITDDITRPNSRMQQSHYPKEVEKFIESQKNASIYKQRQRDQRDQRTRVKSKFPQLNSPSSQVSPQSKMSFAEQSKSANQSIEKTDPKILASPHTPQRTNNFRIKGQVNLKSDFFKLGMASNTQQDFFFQQDNKSSTKQNNRKKYLNGQISYLSVHELLDNDKKGIEGEEQLENAALEPLVEKTQIPNRLSYNKMFKNYERLQEYQQAYQTKPNVYTKMTATIDKYHLLPKQLGLMRYKQNAITSVIGSKQYVELLSEGLQTAPYDNLKQIQLSGNNLNSEDMAKIVSKLPNNTQSLFANNNKLNQKVGFVFSHMLNQKTTKLQILELENNFILDSGVIELLNQLDDNRILKILNISKNGLSDRCAESLAKLIRKSYNLSELYLHYNSFVYMGTFFRALQKNTNLRVLDVSFNRLACSADIATMVGKPHPELCHLDLSYNRLSEVDIQIIQKQLIFNDILCGIHIEGNVEGYYINARGYIVQHEQLKQLNIQFTDQLMDQQMELRMQEEQQYSPLFHRRIVGVSTLGKRKEDAQLQDCCWICEGWVEFKFTWTPGQSGSLLDAPIFLHLECDYYKPMLMRAVDGYFALERMCPPNKLVQYFFSNPLEQIFTYARDQKTQETEAQSQIRNFGLEMNYADGTQLQSKKMGVVNVHKTGSPAIVIDADRHYVSRVVCKPREPEPIIVIDKSQTKVRRWTLDTSWFKDFESDSELRMNECLEFDLNTMKLSKYVKDDVALRTSLQKLYPQFIALYHHYTSCNSDSHFPRITSRLVQEFVDQSNIIPRNLIRQVDVDIHFITSHVNVKNKEFLYLEERCLVRHQFLEFIIRLAKDSYLRAGAGANIAESVELLLQDHLILMRASQEWREKRYWTQLMDLTINFKMPLIRAIFNQAKQGSHAYVTSQQFLGLLKQCDLINGTLTEQEALMIFHQSMVTQIDSVTKNRHCQMSLVEFIEALARVAEKISPSSPAYVQKNLNLSQRRILPLFVKFEGLMFMFFHLLDMKQDQQALATSTIIKTRQARKLGVMPGDSESSIEENDDDDEESGTKVPNNATMFQQIKPLEEQHEDEQLRSRSRKNSDPPVPSPRYLAAPLSSRGSLLKVKRSSNSFNSANLVSNMSHYELKAEIQEQAEFEESSPLKQAQMRKQLRKRTLFNEGLLMHQEEFQFDM